MMLLYRILVEMSSISRRDLISTIYMKKSWIVKFYAGVLDKSESL